MSASSPAAGGDWLAERAPAPPAALEARLRDALRDVRGRPLAADAHAADAAEACLEAAETVLARVLDGGSTGTRSREAALDLLVADALVTYAFEAASDDPAELPTVARGALARLAAAGARTAR